MELLSWGANSHGQLGQGHTREMDLALPSLVDHPKELDVDYLKQIKGGGAHTILVTDGGSLCVCGRNGKGQLSLPLETKDVVMLQHVSFPSLKVRRVACGWDHTLAITDEGSLFSWGANSFSQLGVSSSATSSVSSPIRVNIGPNAIVLDISAGLRHSVALTGDGLVYTWGNGKKGQLGLTGKDEVPLKQVDSPQLVSALGTTSFVSIVCGSYHTVAVSDGGTVYVWGNNDRGQLAHNPYKCPLLAKPAEVAAELFNSEQVKEVHSGWSHLVAVTNTGSVYTWGRNDYGQLGRDTGDKKYDWTPHCIQMLKNLHMVFVGSEHNVVVKANDKGSTVYSWGWNEHGICGTGSEDNVHCPTQIAQFSKNKVVMVGGGCGHTFVAALVSN